MNPTSAIKCPHCGGAINPAALLGGMTSPAKARAARENAKLGGWPKGKKRGKTKRAALRPTVGMSYRRHECYDFTRDVDGG